LTSTAGYTTANNCDSCHSIQQLAT